MCRSATTANRASRREARCRAAREVNVEGRARRRRADGGRQVGVSETLVMRDAAPTRRNDAGARSDGEDYRWRSRTLKRREARLHCCQRSVLPHVGAGGTCDRRRIRFSADAHGAVGDAPSKYCSCAEFESP